MDFFIYTDYILAYEEDIEKKGKNSNNDDEKYKMWREKYIKNLKKSGLEMEEVGLAFLLIEQGTLEIVPNGISCIIFTNMIAKIATYITIDTVFS